MTLILSVGGIYFFIFLGFVAKKIFEDAMDEKSLVLFSIYFLHPILMFWGVTSREFDASVFQAPAIFATVIALALIFSFIFSRVLFENRKDRSIATIASIVGNTGNLGIPLGIALFGYDSVIYTSIINFLNSFFVNSVGVYFYSRGNFSVRKSFRNIFKLPAIWTGLFGIWFNINGFEVHEKLQLPLEMGAYSTMVIQLAIFGMYLYSVKYKEIEWKLFNFVTVVKFVVIPLLAYLVLSQFKLDALVYNVILLELLMPLAVMNVNLAALYDCKPTQVAFLIFSTSIIFLLYLFGMARWMFL